MTTILAQSFGNDPNAKFILMGLVGVVILYVVARPFLQKRKKDPLARPNYAARLSQQRGVERQMETLLVELNDMARQMSAQLDTRAVKLEQLIQDADQRLAELRRLTAGRGARFEEASSAEPQAFMPRFDPVETEPLDPTHARVHRLADEGRSISDIAAELGRPSGEIELILALRPKAAR